MFPRRDLTDPMPASTRDDPALKYDGYSRLFEDSFVQIDGHSLPGSSSGWGVWLAPAAGTQAREFRLLEKKNEKDNPLGFYRSFVLGPKPSGAPWELLLQRPGLDSPAMDRPSSNAAGGRSPGGTVPRKPQRTLVEIQSCRHLTGDEIARLREKEPLGADAMQTLLKELARGLPGAPATGAPILARTSLSTAEPAPSCSHPTPLDQETLMIQSAWQPLQEISRRLVTPHQVR